MRPALCRLASLLGALAATPLAAAAQQADSDACGSRGAVAVRPELVSTRGAGPLAVDTSFQIAVERRRWAVQAVERGAEVAADVAPSAPWHACVGAWVTMDRAEVEIQDAYGQVHIRASLEPLMRVLGRWRPGPGNEP